MRIGVVFYDMQEIGGLEEYAVTLAVGLQQQGHEVSVISTAWVPADNQYLRRLQENHIAFTQLPKWISHPASDWETKLKILNVLTWLLWPLIFLLGTAVALKKRQSLSESMTSLLASAPPAGSHPHSGVYHQPALRHRMGAQTQSPHRL